MMFKLGKIALVQNIGTIQSNKRDLLMPGKHSEQTVPSKCSSSQGIKMELFQLQEPSIGSITGWMKPIAPLLPSKKLGQHILLQTNTMKRNTLLGITGN